MSHLDYIQKLLELKEVLVTDLVNSESHTDIFVELPLKEHECPQCGEMTSYVHDYRNQKVKDVPIHEKPTYLIYRKRRYICKSCNKRFYEDNDFVPHYQHKTNRLNLFILNKLRECVSMSYLARQFKMSVTTISRILDTVSFEPINKLPYAISIDEFKGDAGIGKYQCIITDPQNKKTLDIIETRSEATLHAYFRQYPKHERDQVAFVVIDMWRPYYSCMSRLFPNAKIVIDRFHYVRQVIWSLENTRKRIQKTLTKEDRIYFKNSKKLLIKNSEYLTIEERNRLRRMFLLKPELEEAYLLKENFYYFFQAKGYTQASKRLNGWLNKVKKSGIPEFDACIRCFDNWRNPILNSFTTSLTNAFTEGFNNKIKVLKRVSYGMKNFARFRKRILLMA